MSQSRKDNLTIPQAMLKAYTALINIKNSPDMQVLFDKLGYTEEKILEGMELHKEVTDLIAKQKAEYGEQYAATKMRNELHKKAHKNYISTLKIARIALEHDKSAESALLLSGKREKSLAGWIEQTTVFYNNLINNSDYMEKVASFGYTRERLLAEREQIEDVITASAKQKRESGAAQAATKKRNEVLDTFLSWMVTFYKIVEIALQDHAQWREKLGLFERS